MKTINNATTNLDIWYPVMMMHQEIKQQNNSAIPKYGTLHTKKYHQCSVAHKYFKNLEMETVGEAKKSKSLQEHRNITPSTS